jgi:DNA-directed RNA polymerase specialized sigma24 family protein
MNSFPLTRISVVESLRSEDYAIRERALDTIASIYWKPVYTYIRLKWSFDPQTSEDLTQDFFARSIERDFFAQFDPTRARFRTWLRVGIDRMVANARESANRQKRGGGTRAVPLDSAELERDLATRAPGPLPDDDELFRREVARALFSHAVAALRAECEASGKTVQWKLFAAYDLEGPDQEPKPTYGGLAAEHDVPVTQVTNYLAAMRRRFRALVLERLRELSASDAEFRAEARDVLGVDPGGA